MGIKSFEHFSASLCVVGARRAKRTWSLLPVLLIGFTSLSLAVPPPGTSSTQRRGPVVPDTAGMWMPGQLASQEALLRRLGLDIDVNQLADLDEGLLQAIVSLGFCSGSFISGSGLIVTNHHCVQGMLSYLSQQENERLKKRFGENTTRSVDYVRDGFIAHTLRDERSVGPSQKIFITTKIEEVTTRILEGIEQIADPEQRARTIEARMKALVKEREEGRPQYRVEVKPFFRNAKYFVVEQLELRDVRLVFAPPGTVGYFGGDTDNWHWPRGTGDFSLIRAYVGPDGTSKEFDRKNIPFTPKKYLTVSKAGVNPGDLNFVFGYPGRTTRASTASEVRSQMNTTMPSSIHFWKSLIQRLKALGEKSHDLHVKTESPIFSYSNALKKNEEALKSLQQLGYVDIREKFEEGLLSWLNADAGRRTRFVNASGQTPIDEIRLYRESIKNRQDQFSALNRLLGFTPLVASAHNILRLAQERPKADTERNPAFQERNWRRLEQAEETKQSSYAREINIETFALAVEFAIEEAKQSHDSQATPGLAAVDDLPSYLRPFVELKAATSGNAAAALHVKREAIEALFSGTTLENLETRLSLLKTGTSETLAASQDPLIAWYRDFALGVALDQERFSYEFTGDITPIEQRYIAMLEEYATSQGKVLAPDANSTLRATFGVVAGYDSPSRGRVLPPQTNFDAIIHKMERLQYVEPTFRIPPAIREMIYRLRGEWEGSFPVLGDPNFGSLPVNFLSTVDTTGGNSGSAALNKFGELIGLLFDGNDDTLYGDHIHDEKVRSILLDIRYFLAYLALGVGQPAHRILRELTVTPDGCEELFDPALTRRPQENI